MARPAIIFPAALLVLSAVLFFTAPRTAMALNLQDAREAFENTGEAAFGSKPASLPAMAATIIRSALSLLGIIFLGLTLYGGYQWMMAGGEAKNVQEAKDTLTRAIIGLFIIITAYAITQFVVSTLVEATR